MSATAHPLPPDLQAALVEFAKLPTVLIALDFDGVMAPLVPRPEDSRPLPATQAIWKRLAALPQGTPGGDAKAISHRGTWTALVSGRSLDSLIQVADPPVQTVLIGSHGAEYRAASPTGQPEKISYPQLDEFQQRALHHAHEDLQTVIRAFPEARSETKPAGVVLHTRGMSAPDAQAASAKASELLSEREGVHVSYGKAVVETSVVHTDKGQALAKLRSQLGVDAIFFAGDDVTDENGFRALGPADVGLKVGAGPSAAPFRIAEPQDLAAVLETIWQNREGVTY